ncbi:MAG TPA: ECF-type sigma factor [Rhodothermales bacterium]|nr:ECF-type sigma factor [Rhodothermales bacterium]
MSPDETTALLAAVRDGDARAADELFAHVYAELRRLAGMYLAGPSGAVTLSSTDLVHEAYLKMAGGSGWADRAHFTAVAARAMRQILTDRARARHAKKRGGTARAGTLNADYMGPDDAAPEDILAVDAALDRLAAHDADLARLVELRFFGAMEVNEVAEVLGLSPRTAARRWAVAKALLRTELSA